MEHRFQVERRTRKEARDMIMAIARHGNHYWDREWGVFTTTRHVERFLAAYDLTLAGLIETLRDKDASGNPFENRLGSGWTVSGGGGGAIVGYTDSEGNEVVRMEEPGSFSTATSTALFEKAVDDFERSISKMSYVESLSCIASGTASIEAYVFQKTYQRNIRNPGKELVDDKNNKVSFEDKIKVWVPMMAGKKLNLGDKNWAHFQRLKRVRDTEHTHTKSPALNITYRELCKLLNLFRGGIAGMLLDLHVLFGDKTPSKVIKYAYHPDIKLVTFAEEAG